MSRWNGRPRGCRSSSGKRTEPKTAGLVKIDLLGNRSLGVIRDAVANAAKRRFFDEHRWEPEDDPATQEAVARARPWGAFTSKARPCGFCRKRPRGAISSTWSSTAASSARRPTSSSGNTSAACAAAAWDPIHPLLADVLDETFGIMVYQEDVSRAAVALAGFSHAEADGLRKIMSKKDREHDLADYRDAVS
jgi:error-prone DNA polymerase